MRKLSAVTLATAAAILALAFGATTALGASPHFKKDGTPSCTDTGTQLACTGSITGLGNGDVTLELTANAEGTFACVNPGGNESPGQNKVPFSVSTTKVIPGSEVKNGNLTFTVAGPTTPPTATPQEAGCPNGNWTTRLTDLSFTNITLKISQNNVLLFTCTAPQPGALNCT
jgi:hypothetical protein